MKKELKHLRRQICRWIMGFENCPAEYRNNFAMKVVEAAATVIFTIGIICLFFMLIILLQLLTNSKKYDIILIENQRRFSIKENQGGLIMKETHYFQCEHCGKTFTDEDECRKHELTEEIDSTKFQALDLDNDPIAWPWGWYEYEHTKAIWIKDEEAWAFLDTYIQHELGYCSPMEVLKIPLEWPVVVYNTDGGDTWINVRSEYNRFRFLKEEYLDKLPKV